MNCIWTYRIRVAEEIAGLSIQLEEAGAKFHRLVEEARNKGLEVSLPHDGTYMRLCLEIAQGIICPPQDNEWRQALSYSWTLLARSWASPLRSPDLIVEMIQQAVIDQSSVAREYRHYLDAKRWSRSMDLPAISGHAASVVHAECARMWLLLDPNDDALRGDYPEDILRLLCGENRAAWWAIFTGYFDFDSHSSFWDGAAGILVRGKPSKMQIDLVRQRIREINSETSANSA